MKILKDYIEKNDKMSIVFDFDLTIARIDMDWSGWHKIHGEIIEKYDNNYKYKPGDMVHSYLNDYIRKYGKEIRDELWAANQKYEEDNSTGVTPYPELVDFISNNTDLDLYVYSSNSKLTVMNGLHKLKIDDAFEKIVARDDVMYIKPDPDGVRLVLGDEPDVSKFLMVGDSSADKGAAEAIGMDFFRVDRFGTH